MAITNSGSAAFEAVSGRTWYETAFSGDATSYAEDTYAPHAAVSVSEGQEEET